jgi:hypothetical protein
LGSSAGTSFGSSAGTSFGSSGAFGGVCCSGFGAIYKGMSQYPLDTYPSWEPWVLLELSGPLEIVLDLDEIRNGGTHIGDDPFYLAMTTSSWAWVSVVADFLLLEQG